MMNQDYGRIAHCNTFCKEGTRHMSIAENFRSVVQRNHGEVPSEIPIVSGNNDGNALENVLLDLHKDFEASKRENLKIHQDRSYHFAHLNLKVRVSVSWPGTEERTQHPFLPNPAVISAVVHSIDSTKRQLYTLMTNVLRMNTIHKDVKIIINQGKLVAFTVIDDFIPLLNKDDNMGQFSVRLTRFLMEADIVEKELRDLSRKWKSL
jgi:hypothetical protein